ncbi:MAG: lysophospholipid acyltransferase family protein [Gemmataceae bacterium]
MQQVVIAKPYQFVPPHQGVLWPWLLQKWLPGHLRRKWGVSWPEFHGLERLKASQQAGHSVLLAPNHCRPCDPFVLALLGAELNQPFYTMASWHLFMQGRLQRWLLRRAGAFSVFREGLDREALKTASQLLVEARRPLVIFPEGVITRANDRLGYVMDGVAFIARSAAKIRAKAEQPGQVVIHPLALRYTFGGDLRQAVEPVLDMIERRIGWQPYCGTSLVERVRKLGEALLSVKEIEYFGMAQSGPRAERLPQLIDRVLGPPEDRYLSGKREATTVARIKKLRAAILPPLTNHEGTAEEQASRWRHLADCTFAQMLEAYSGGYLDGEPTTERLLETVERYEEDTTDEARTHRPLTCRMEIGDALPVSVDRPRGEADPLTAQLEDRLKAMLAASAPLCHPWKE